MNTLRVANKKERHLFEETLRGDINKIPNVNSKLYGYQVYQPIVPNNQHNNQYGSPYHNSLTNNVNDVLINNTKFDLGNNQQQKYYSTNNLNNHNYDQSINNDKFINNLHNTQNIGNTGNNNNMNDSKIDYNNYVPNSFVNTNKGNLNPINNNYKSVQKTKRDHVWEAKKQKYQQTYKTNLPLSSEIPGKRIIDKMQELKHEIIRSVTPNNLDNYNNVRSNIYSGASSSEVKRTPINNNNYNKLINQNMDHNYQSHNSSQQIGNYNNFSKTNNNSLNVYDYRQDGNSSTKKTPFNKENLTFDENTLKNQYKNIYQNGQYNQFNTNPNSNLNHNNTNTNHYNVNNNSNSSRINGINLDIKQVENKGDFKTTYNSSYRFEKDNNISPYSLQNTNINNQNNNNYTHNISNNQYSKPFNNSVKFY